jgi:type II secretory pathway pseudopilin PulG
MLSRRAGNVMTRMRHLLPGLRSRGFTALEVTAVAAIIALMALILIPIVRSRVEDAKLVAAQDDMNSIEKAETLVFADTGKFVRLQDLIRPQADPLIIADPGNGGYARELERPPQAVWNRAMTSTEIVLMAKAWKGPQAAFHRSQPIASLIAQAPYLFTQVDTVGLAPSGGPILFLTGATTGDVDVAIDAGIDATLPYPVDPWGNPYLFFGRGFVTDPLAAAGTAGGLNPTLPALPPPQTGTEINYGTAAVYSLGPDGRPGTTAAITDPLSYYREAGILGATGGDDLVREF